MLGVLSGSFFRGGQLLVIPENLSGGLVFPVCPLLDRPIESDGLGGAIGSAAAAVPAFIRVQDHWGLLFFRVGDKDIHLADFHAVVATDTGFRIENYRISRADNIRQRIDFFARHGSSPYFP
jgi:hypothetical protein